MEPDILFIDIRTCGLTLSEALAEIRRIQAENPDYDVFLDGDAHAVIGRRKF